jgi:hypothetical protein
LSGILQNQMDLLEPWSSNLTVSGSNRIVCLEI